MSETTNRISDTVIRGKAKETRELVENAIKAKVHPGEILNNGLIAGMSVIGERFKKNEVYVPEVLIAARAMKAGMEPLKPLLAQSGVKPIGTVVIGTVKGDLHDIGKNLVGMMLEGAGFKVVDIGIDADAQKFLDAAKANDAGVVGLSALLTTTMTYMKTVVETFKQTPLPVKTRIMVGGAPLTQAFSDEIGADGYAPDAASAADLAKKLVA